MKCTNCGTENEAGNRFCLRCGTILSGTSSPGQTGIPSTPSKQGFSAETNLPAADPGKISVSDVGRTLWKFSSQQLSQGREKISAFNIWGPFAGYGTRRIHLGWLMDNKGDQADVLIDRIAHSFSERSIPDTSIEPTELTAKGVLVERRPYFILRRDLVSIGLHIRQFGRDLFISLASYLKPPISRFRVGLLIFSVALALYMGTVFPFIMSTAIDSVVPSSLFAEAPPPPDWFFYLFPINLCLIGPLGFLNSLLLFVFFLYSFYKWLKEKDFWAGLRVPPNEFNEDDLMAMEKAVEQTVRIALDAIGLDPNDLKPSHSLDSGRRLI